MEMMRAALLRFCWKGVKECVCARVVSKYALFWGERCGERWGLSNVT